MIDHCSYAHNLSSCEIKAWKKNSDLNMIQTLDLCDTSAVLYQLSCHLSHLEAGHIVSLIYL